ncbi:YHS domain-containing (seleno)protein [Pseudolabrys sp.]|uniref:YHS domain-containing (seleno)protein n=2 Tax=Pseudolabrys sp. TaxID=1960880 RepID=UPI003D0A677C
MTTMSIAGRFRKAWMCVTVLVAALGFGLSGILLPQAGWGATTERVVSDPASGLAISGFDPVGYFTDAAAKFGRPDIEERYAGAVWRFRNAGNRAAFVAHPAVYMPQFGGYDPVGIAAGKSVAGHPLHWAIKDQRLYLFYDAQTRAAFLADTARILGDAERRWPAVEKTLTP